MTEQTKQWEYRVQTIGSAFSGTKDEQIEAVLNEWGQDGWEAVNAYAPSNSSKVTLVAKRLVTPALRRLRSWP
jgi:hypothetical protein